MLYYPGGSLDALFQNMQLDDAREADMLSEAATVEAVWAVEPSFLDDVLSRAIDMFCGEQVCLYAKKKEESLKHEKVRVVSFDLHVCVVECSNINHHPYCRFRSPERTDLSACRAHDNTPT